MGFGFWVLGFGFWVLVFGFWVLGFGFWVLGFGLGVEGAGVKGCEFQDGDLRRCAQARDPREREREREKRVDHLSSLPMHWGLGLGGRVRTWSS